MTDNWFDILKTGSIKTVDPRDMVFFRHTLENKVIDYFFKLAQNANTPIAPYMKEAKELKWALINAAFFDTPIPTKMRILLKRISSRMDKKAAVAFNALIIGGNRAIRSLPFDLSKDKTDLASTGSVKNQLKVKFEIEVKEGYFRFRLGRLWINEWYTQDPVPLTDNISKFMKMWEYMADYNGVKMILRLIPWGENPKVNKKMIYFSNPKDITEEHLLKHITEEQKSMKDKRIKEHGENLGDIFGGRE